MTKDKEIVKLKNQFFASCPVGLEEVLEREIQELDISQTTKTRGGVLFESYPQHALKVILYSKIASRVFKRLYSFVIKNEGDLYFRSKEIKWKSIFNLDQTFKIETIQGLSPNGQKRSKFKSSVFLSQKFKDGIVDAFREKLGKRPDVDTNSPDASLLLRITPQDNEFSSKEDVQVLIDLCGRPLSHRGYRQRGFVAPLRENLAAGIIALTGFPQKSFLDLMTGSGTLAIEAALYKAKIPGAYLQIMDHFDHDDDFSYNFLDLNFFTKDKYLPKEWKELVEQAYLDTKNGLKELRKNSILFMANDIDKKSAAILNGNIENALLSEVIKVSHDDAKTIKQACEDSLIIVNPPYGERLGEDQDLENLYHQVGENLKHNYKGNTAYIFTGNLPLLKKISLQSSKRIILFNGNIESRLVEYKLY